MIEVGVSLSSEEHGGSELVRQAIAAERAGFRFAGISDHFHPWLDAQGQSPFVWSVLGGIAASTDELEIGTMVTCPTIRTHPAIIAQAAATIGEMMEGRFFLGLGSGENLNEHVVGLEYPRTRIRIEMLEEATEIIRLLWSGKNASFDGMYFTIANARIYTMPREVPPIYIAASGPVAASLAGRAGDGFISTSPQKDLVDIFRKEGNTGPTFGQLTVCLAETEEEGLRTATKIWPNSAMSGSFKQELPLPMHFEQVSENVTAEQVGQSIICSKDPQVHIDALREFEAAGFTRVYVHQVGPDKQRFLDFYKQEVTPSLSPVA